MEDKSVEIGRQKIVSIGGSPYILVPRLLRAQYNASSGDEVSIRRVSGSTDIILRFEPKTQDAAK
jgi:hypothetical protein